MEIAAPYLMFLGDVPDDLAAKTAHGIVDWRPEWCLGQLRLPGCRADLKIPDLTVPEAAERGARTMVVGVVNAGGVLPDHWVPVIVAARKHGRRLFDVRHSSQRFATGKGTKRSGLRLLTVGTDCSVGKKYTALALEREMRARGFDADFRATGQTGVFISGRGVAIDAVVADFISGAVEWISPAADEDHWDLIEGQGSLFHPSFAGVSLGLLHGAQPDAVVICHEPTRTRMRGVQHPLPSIEEVIDLNLRCGRLTNPAIRPVGIAVNTEALGEGEAQGYLDTLAADYKLPAVDPVRFGVGEIVDRVAHEFPQAAPQDGRLARASA